MLATVRKSLGSWMFLLLLGLVLVAFIVTGITPMGDSKDGSTVLAKVGGEKITTTQVQQRFEQLYRMRQRETPTLARTDLIKAGALEEVTQMLTAAAAFEVFADKEGVVAGPAQITQAIKTIPAFQTNGVFDKTRYEMALQDMQLTPKQFQRELGLELIRSRFASALKLGSQPPQGVAQTYASLLLEQRQAKIIVVPRLRFQSSATPDEAAISRYFASNKKQYARPEGRSFTYAMVSAADLADAIPVTDADIKTHYETHSDQYAGSERRAVDQLVAPDAQSAQKIMARLNAGEDFLKAAETLGFSAQDIDLGTVTKAEFATTAGTKAATALFAAKKGAVIGPIQTDLGLVIARTRDIMAAGGKTLAAASDEIRKQIQMDRAVDKIYELERQLSDELASGSSLESAAAGLEISVAQVQGVSRKGQDASGQPLTGLPESQKLLEMAFAQQAEDDGAVEEIAATKDSPPRFIAVDVTAVIPRQVQPLATVRGAVIADMQSERGLELAKAEAERLTKLPFTTLDNAAQSQQLPQVQNVRLRRLEVMQQARQAPPPILAILALPQGGAKVMPIGNNEGFYVVRVGTVTPGSTADVAALTQATAQELTSVRQAEQMAAFIVALQAQSKTKLNEAALATFRLNSMGRP